MHPHRARPPKATPRNTTAARRTHSSTPPGPPPDQGPKAPSVPDSDAVRVRAALLGRQRCTRTCLRGRPVGASVVPPPYRYPPDVAARAGAPYEGHVQNCVYMRLPKPTSVTAVAHDKEIVAHYHGQPEVATNLLQ